MVKLSGLWDRIKHTFVKEPPAEVAPPVVEKELAIEQELVLEPQPEPLPVVEGFTEKSEPTAEPAVEPEVKYVPEPEAKVVLERKNLRQGMWVVSPRGVGIVKALREDGVEVALVDGFGLNRFNWIFHLDELKQAQYEQIPFARRGSRHSAQLLGY